MGRRWMVLALAGLVIAGCGAPGIGDRYFPTYGNGGYDVAHYDLAVRFDPATGLLGGGATISARTVQPLATFDLDFVGMNVRSVVVDGQAARWKRGPHELVVIPRHLLKPGRSFTTVVRYDGTPSTFTNPSLGAGGFFHTADGAFVMGQPESAANWFPVNDHPLDKASYTFHVTVPDGVGVVANGLPAGTTSAAGWTTHVWEARSPMASYLATIDIGQWAVTTRHTAAGLPIIDAVDPAVASLVTPSLTREPEMLAFLESQFGRYPFETVGGIVDNQTDALYSLETQTRPNYSVVAFLVGQGDTTVVHELAHQWFGDSVALARWQDIWLNEGFATYAEWLWTEHEGLPNAPEVIFEDGVNAHGASDAFWDLPIGDPGPDHLFDIEVYDRGAMTLQALRNTVGDTSFFAILRTWAATNAGGHGTTARFIALAERISGQQLDGLFHAWLFAPDRPTVGVPPVAVPVAPDAASTFAAPTAVDDRATAWRDGLARRLAYGRF